MHKDDVRARRLMVEQKQVEETTFASSFVLNFLLRCEVLLTSLYHGNAISIYHSINSFVKYSSSAQLALHTIRRSESIYQVHRLFHTKEDLLVTFSFRSKENQSEAQLPSAPKVGANSMKSPIIFVITV